MAHCKTRVKILGLLIIHVLICIRANSTNNINILSGNWQIIYQANTGKTVDFIYKGQTILKGISVQAKDHDILLKSSDYSDATLTQDVVTDVFGIGTKFTITYTDISDKSNLQQCFYFYPGRDYFLTEAYIQSQIVTSSNYIAPIVTTTKNSFLTPNVSNRVLTIPFDNDGFVRYGSYPLRIDSVSFEVTSVFNGIDRKGLIIGSVEHDTWKTGIRFSTTYNQYLNKLECYGGITHALTRDINPDKTSKVHGSILGKLLKSPKILVGMFDDWRNGLDEFGRANALITPPRKWTGGTPFGWNSWGGMETKVNYNGVIDVSDFIKTQLEPKTFENNGFTYIGLDSWWNENFSLNQLRMFATHCKLNGQKAGIYFGPFSYWGATGDDIVPGTNNVYKYKDLFLYANGVPRSIESIALDPTHPGTKQNILYQINQFIALGFEYVKLDFINSGILEADSFYNKNVTTGVQAYNEGMHYVDSVCGEKMYIAESIAPTFPAQYGNSKRLSCDTWGAMDENIGSTGYLLNSLSFGWWLDKVYDYNDADHLVLYPPDKQYSEGANRARITSGVITGIYMLGDNLSQKGTFIGDTIARTRVLKYATNTLVNEIARLGRSFYPVEGYTAATYDHSEALFMLDTKNYIYLAGFNFNTAGSKTGSIQLSRLGISEFNVSSITELWTSDLIPFSNGAFAYSVPAQDARIYRIEKAITRVDILKQDTSVLSMFVNGSKYLEFQSNQNFRNVKIYSIDGKLQISDNQLNVTLINVDRLSKGIYLVRATTSHGKCMRGKFLK